jgi:hypothetical protein
VILKGLALLLLIVNLIERSASAQDAPLTRIEIGAIVGAQYIPGSERFFLYAEPANGSLHAVLWRDEVVQLARASLAVGQKYGFSLDFSRRGTKNFKPEDIYDFTSIAARLSKPDAANPILSALGASLGSLRVPAPSAKPAKNEVRRLTGALNHLMADRSLLNALCREETNPDAAPLLKDGCDTHLARLIIEDFVGRGLRRDIEHRYVITYKPIMANDDLRQIFSSTRAEAVMLSGDAWLKTLAGDGGLLPRGLEVGPSEVNLCAEEAMAASEQGRDIPGGERAEYFGMDFEYAQPPDLPAKVIWFADQRLIVSTGRDEDSPPDCSDRFAADLNKNLPRILNYDGQLGSDLRNLSALLELSRSVNYFTDLAPIDVQYLLTVPTERIRNVPPPVVDTPIRFAASGRALGYRSFGGVIFGGSSLSGIPAVGQQVETPSGGDDPADRKPIEPGFIVKTVEIDGNRLLRIEISSILMKTANPRNKPAAEISAAKQEP